MLENTMKNAIATPHWEATEAGKLILENGGTAVDASIAAALALCVVYPQDCALGGDLIALIRSPAGKKWVVNASGPAPQGMEQAVKNSGLKNMPEIGPLTVTVPGAIAGLEALHELGGVSPWEILFQSAITLAHEGTQVSTATARFLVQEWHSLSQDPGMREVFTNAESGLPFEKSSLLKQPALATTLKTLSTEGAKSFYRGTLGRTFARGLQQLDSPLRSEDLANYRPAIETPIQGKFQKYQVSTAGSNAQGASLLMFLAAMDQAGLNADPLGSDFLKLVSLAEQTSQLRDVFIGDHHVIAGTPLDWRSPEAVEQLISSSESIDSHQSTAKRLGGDTVAIVATDNEGWSVSLIQSVYEPFGAHILEPATGIVCHNRGSAFELQRGHPNVLEDGKRPLHTLIPVLVESEGEIFSVQGTMGGKAQPQIHAQVLGSIIAGFSPVEAVSRPRWVVGGREADSSVIFQCEAGTNKTSQHLESTGLQFERLIDLHDAVGHVQAIIKTEQGFCAVSDPRSDGTAEIVDSHQRSK